MKILTVVLVLSCTSCTRTDFFSTPVFKDISTFQVNTASIIGMRLIDRSRSAALKLFSLLNLCFPLLQPSWTKQTNLLVSESGKIKEKKMTQACYEVKQKISETSSHQELWILVLVLISHGTVTVGKQPRELLQPF